MKKKTSDKWDERCKNDFEEIKATLTRPPVMCRAKFGQAVPFYLSVFEEAINVALVQEDAKQKPIYFISRVLQNAKAKY